MNSKTLFLLSLFALCLISLSASALGAGHTGPDGDHDGDHSTPEPTPTAEPEDEVCVDAKYLSSYPSHMLVHAKAIRASVLCPKLSTLPCATADHMVRVGGVATSYRQYCARKEVSCEARRMPVNSVLSHLWEESVHKGGVALTMFDYRHPEMMQKMMHRAVAVKRAVVRKVWA